LAIQIAQLGASFESLALAKALEIDAGDPSAEAVTVAVGTGIECIWIIGVNGMWRLLNG
jgi:hypothetical protein